MSKENEKLQEAIQKAVEDNLPKAQGTLLQKRLAKADELEIEVKHLSTDLADLRKVNSEIRSENDSLRDELSKFKSREKAIEDDEINLAVANEELKEKQNKLELTLIKNELVLIRESKEEIKALTDRVFRNHTVRESVIRTSNDFNDGCGYSDSNGNWVPGRKNGESTTIDVTKTAQDED